MIACTLDISIEDDGWLLDLPDIEAVCQAATEMALDMADVDWDGARAVEISLLLTHNTHVQQLNRDWRGHDKPTNVLSFAALDEDDMPRIPDAPVLLGDVVMALGVCQQEAIQQAIPFRNHVCHLMVHGVLHLLGYDHEQNDAEADEMEALETAILARFNIPDPYGSTSHQ